MSDNKNVDNIPEKGELLAQDTDIAVAASEVSSVAGSVTSAKTHHRVSSSSERQIKFERAQKCLENAALVSKRIKEHRKATAELLGRPFEDDDGDTVSEMASTVSERTSYSVATDSSAALSVQDALNIPGISESLANTLKQKELLMERIKQYKEISKKPIYKSSPSSKKDSTPDAKKVPVSSEVTQLNNTIREKENALSLIQVKMKTMENTILDLQEKINEKDQIIDAKNKANILISENSSKKEKELMELLDDTRQQMTKMQENFVTIETTWNEEKKKMQEEISEKDEKIRNLEEAKTILDNSRFEISIDQSKLAEELDSKTKEIFTLKEQINSLSLTIQETSKAPIQEEVEKASTEVTDVSELVKKLEFLEQLNCELRQANKELETSISKTPEPKALGSPSKSTKSPLPSRKGARSGKAKSPWSNLSSESLPQETDKKSAKTDKLEAVIQSLNKDILEKEFNLSKKDTLITELQSTITSLETDIGELNRTVQEPKVEVDVVDVAVLTESIDILNTISSESAESVMNIPNLEKKLQNANDQITSLTNEIEAANKNMIKVKSNHKIKLKQMQKTIDNFSKVSDSNAEIVKLNEEMHQLTQKVAELEEEKGNLQLHLVDYDSGRLTESDIYKKLLEMENLAEIRLKSISVLEAQKFDLVQELHMLQQKNSEMEDKLVDMSHLHSEQVSSEMKSVQLEEQVDELLASKKELELVIENLKLDKEHLNGTIKVLEEEKEEFNLKLQHYIQENIELTDKLEKLSAEKVSSAESIEIVESLTTQEKLELEEYNKGMTENKSETGPTEDYQGTVSPECNENIEKLVEESAELNKKIELFTQERQEVMEKMSHINSENDLLQKSITELTERCKLLEGNIELLNKEKQEFQVLTDDLNRQIEELRQERIEVIKETVDVTKPSSLEDVGEAIALDVGPDDKSTGDKANNRTKSVKQLTKEILKLKNTIKEREAEIGDCQMKILSLEEQQQKQIELIQNNASYEGKIKALIEENNQLRDELNGYKKDNDIEQQLVKLQEANNLLHLELQNIQTEYSNTINIRDARIHELENLLLDYEKQIFNYGNTLQQKDKEIVEYINQITKLNDVSQKLKSTVDLLEEEKSKDQNTELIKSLNKQITVYQRKLSEYEEQLKILDDEKSQLLNVKSVLESKNISIDLEIKNLQETLNEKQTLIAELQTQQQKHEEGMSSILLEAKERDEEIHEIKLQLRKESIENEKLRTSLSQKENASDEITKEFEEKLNQLYNEKTELNEKLETAESKNKELMEKLKKFAGNLKKKTAAFTALETEFQLAQTQLEAKNSELDQILAQVQDLPAMQDRLKQSEEEMMKLRTQKTLSEQETTNYVAQLHAELKSLQERIANADNEISKLNEAFNSVSHEQRNSLEENESLKSHNDTLNKKLVEYEIELKNNTNFTTKISNLETELNQKQYQIEELLNKMQSQEQHINQLSFGYDAKVQERDLYIESLDAEINKYKNRICRLEDTISTMEDRRHSLERKADQLGSQLQEKQKAYTEYTSQEDELVSRLAVLMDHDRVVEKQLHEIESENRELQLKVQHLSEENYRLKQSLSDIQEYCNTLTDKASKADQAETEVAKYQGQHQEIESQLKRITQDHQNVLAQRKRDIEELESEFNTQIENAIKEKKMLSEKYEKTCEHINRLEMKLQEYVTTIQTLNINIDELTKINHDLHYKCSSEEVVRSTDYTEQYINEINKLNSIVNNKNQETSDLNDKIQSLQTNNSALVYRLEHDISELHTQLQHYSNEIRNLNQQNQQLQFELRQKEDQLKQLSEKKSVSFEMNIPKTEGMVISSRIEAISGEPVIFDMSSLESQIVDEPVPDTKHETKISEQTQKQASDKSDTAQTVTEQIIVPKTAYLCYKGEEHNPQETDPFNSDEGWGLGESEEVSDVTPGLSHLRNEIRKLQTVNETLKNDIQTSNTKLLKAMKKLKELKSANDMLTDELNISKQLSQSSFLDTAIEDELRNNIQELEKKIEDINAELLKEKREKETLRKQNEVFNSANDRLTEMKEKMDNEIELWKYKFKEANDKMSTLQWEGDAKDSPDHKQKTTVPDVQSAHLAEEILKIEKENDELHLIIEQLNHQNNELSVQQAQLKEEIAKQSSETTIACESCCTLNNRLTEIENENKILGLKVETLNKELSEIESKYTEVKNIYESLKLEHDNLKTTFETNQGQLTNLEDEIKSLKVSEAEAVNKTATLMTNLAESNSKLLGFEQRKNMFSSTEVENAELLNKYNTLEKQYLQLQTDLEKSRQLIDSLKSENSVLLEAMKDNEQQIKEFNKKIENLNTENDQLLSTVAELRSSISTAVDQRGFEIAELWKQHLAQREADFQNTEQDLRTKLSASEAKYEQLLDSVQSSSQEETNTLIIMEQVSSLNNKLQDKEEHLTNLQDKYAEAMNQLDLLRSELEDEKVMHENKLLGQEEDYEKQIQEIMNRSQKDTETFEPLIQNLQLELASVKTTNADLLQQLSELKESLYSAKTEIADLNNQLQMKESEIYQKTHEFTITLTQRNDEFENVRKQLIDYEKRVEDLSFEKESELAVLRLKMHEEGQKSEQMLKESDAEKEMLSAALNDKIIECTNLNKQIADLNKLLEEQAAQGSEMQSALENQEYEIVTLKDEIKHMQDALRSSASRIEKHVTFSSDTKPGVDSEKTEESLQSDLLDAVPRAELDLALYMLHQRDVRCEELTMELTQLLEERDTLQLRLSDSLRSMEEIKSKCISAGLDVSMNSSQDTISDLPSFSAEKEQQFVDTHRGQSSRSSSIGDPDGDKLKLQAKLSELRSVKQSRDVTLRQDSEQRQLGLRLMQRDVAQLPPEAVHQLTQAHHTLSRDSQSTSTVLLNWLRGKSTPKVVHM